MKKSKWTLGLLLLVLALGLVVLVAACGSTEETTTTAAPGPDTTAAPATDTTAAPSSDTTAPAAMETLKIGAILSLTDWYSVVDAADKVDLEYVAQMINDDGGIQVQGKSYKIELVIEDGKSTLDGNSASATKLVLDDKLQFVIGPGAFFNLATTPIFEQNKVLHVANYNGLNPAEMNKDTPYAFLGLDPITQQSAALKALKEYYPDVKNIAMATEDATYPAFEAGFKDLVTRTGLTLVGDPVLFATNAEDYNPVASKIKALNPDAVWMPIGIDPSFFGIVKGLRTLGYEGPIAFPVDAPSVVGALGDAATGIVGILSKQVDDPNIAAPMKRLLEMGDPNRHVFGLAPNALYMLAYAIEAADSLDPTEVAKKWETLTSIPTLYGDGFPSGNQLFGLTNHAWANPIPVCLINNGQIEYKPWILPDVTP
ncbi:MAG TPA: ABC transporter substrate-binding protein [Thermoleophilia bacterium]|nr:ABC transporter substrate-binding protein [Thermoleophilia bacterium]